jgi:hypothetical protein
MLWPRTVTTRHEIVTARTRTMDPDARLFVHAHVADATIVVDAAWFGRCHIEEQRVEQVLTEQKVGIKPNFPGGDDDPKTGQVLFLFWVLGSVVTFPITTIATTAVVAFDRPDVTWTQLAPRVTATECPAAPTQGLVVELVLPSGVVLRATTAGDGRARFALPPPDGGPLIVRAGGQDIAIDPSQPRTCADEHLATLARLDVTPETDRTALVATLPDCHDGRARAWAMLERTAVAVLRDCSTIHSADQEMEALDPAFHRDVFAKEPHIARCRDPHEACRVHRAELMRSAQKITSTDERAKYLMSLSDCDHPPGEP